MSRLGVKYFSKGLDKGYCNPYNAYKMENDKEFTTIQISRELQQILVKLGRKGESYDQIIKRILTGKEIVKSEVS